VKISLKLFATLAAHLPAEVRSRHRLELEVAPGATVLEVIQGQGLPPGQCAIVLVDGVWVAQADRATRELAEGEVLAIWPPVAGG
jgi:sulfur carrier protein ThiS